MSNISDKSNFLELKTLEYYFHKEKEGYKKAKNVFELRHKLKTRGFELYVKYYLLHIGYNMDKNFTGGNGGDGGIDLIGKTNDSLVYVQCKKYFTNYEAEFNDDGEHNPNLGFKGKIGVRELRDFYGGVVSKNKGNITDKKIKMIFATTGFFSYYAKEFAEKNDIELWDYKKIGEATLDYSLEQFKYDFKLKGNNPERILRKEKQAEKNQLSLNFGEENDFNLINEDELIKYLKNIRENIIYTLNRKDTKTYTVMKNKTLYRIIKSEEYTYIGLKKYFKNYHDREEVEKINLFGKEFLKGLNLLKNNNYQII